MTWVRTDDKAPQHDKLRAAGTVGYAVWNAALGYCNHHETDGRLETRKVKDVWQPFEEDLDYEAAAQRLVDVGLWHDSDDDCTSPTCPAHPDVASRLEPVAGGHFVIHDYFDYQPSKAQLLAEREKAKERQQKSRAKKLHEALGGGERHTVSHGVTEDGLSQRDSRSGESVSHGPPVPVPVPVPDLRTYGRHTVTNAVTDLVVSDAASFETVTGVALTPDQERELLPVVLELVQKALSGADAPKVRNRSGYVVGKLRKLRAGSPKTAEHEAALARERKQAHRVAARAPPEEVDDEGSEGGEVAAEARADARAKLGI